VHRATYCARNDPLPLLPSGPGGVGGITSRRTRHTTHSNIQNPSAPPPGFHRGREPPLIVCPVDAPTNPCPLASSNPRSFSTLADQDIKHRRCSLRLWRTGDCLPSNTTSYGPLRWIVYFPGDIFHSPLFQAASVCRQTGNRTGVSGRLQPT
jgi:hypothetical protein